MKRLLPSGRGILNLLVILIFLSVLVYAYESGITGRTLKTATNGCYCHGATASSNVSVVISGPDTLTVNQTASYTITISGGPLVAAGTDIAASGGTLSIIQGNPDLQLINGELTHISPKEAGSDTSVSFQFNFTAGSTPGTDTIYANGNSVNLSGTSTGDEWNFAKNFSIDVTNVSGLENVNIATSYRLDQNYPNPFNPSTKITFEIPKAGYITLKVYDILGREITTLVSGYKSPGRYSATFGETSGNMSLSSGVYIYKLTALSDKGNFTQTKKMLLLR